MSCKTDRYLMSQRRTGKSLLPVLVAILVIGGAAAIWIWSRPASQPSVSAGRAAAEQFLQHLQAGKPDAAWEGTTAEFKSAQGKERFVREMKTKPLSKEPFEFVSMQTVDVQNAERSEFLYRMVANETVRILISRDAGDWKVDRWTR